MLNLTVLIQGVESATPHPSDDQIHLAMAGAPPAADQVISHARGCQLCRKRLEVALGRLVRGEL